MVPAEEGLKFRGGELDWYGRDSSGENCSFPALQAGLRLEPLLNISGSRRKDAKSRAFFCFKLGSDRGERSDRKGKPTA